MTTLEILCVIFLLWNHSYLKQEVLLRDDFLSVNSDLRVDANGWVIRGQTRKRFKIFFAIFLLWYHLYLNN